ncbi:nickel-type superoxide dismutase maturation protease [Streptomyces sp. 549]|uniref:nickel-type superoxide dismutase maturation protease n=1 Tax=Streptomyces sp. 549 TaxID=3049076 RepID=UPI0032E3685D
MLRRIGLAEVYNPSMLPTLRPGDRLVLRYGGRVRSGRVVVLRHPFQHDLLVVKRVVGRRSAGWWVQGDNPAVVNDSREFGAVPDDLVVATALVRFRPPAGLQRTPGSLAGWLLSAVRPLPRRLRAR